MAELSYFPVERHMQRIDMTTSRTNPVAVKRHAPFRSGFINVALAVALFMGFAIGAHLSFVIGFDFPLGKGFYSFIQTHGHVQLVGWVGLFIIGISLHFLPRLAGVPVSQPKWMDRALALIAMGLLLRGVGHSVVPYLVDSAWLTPVNWVVALSGLLELGGILIYLSLLIGIFRSGARGGERPAITPVAPFFFMMVAGWAVYASLNLVLLIHMALSNNVVVSPAWNEFGIHVFIGLVLLPVAFAFSVRTFPLYLRLPAPEWPVRNLAYAYLIAFCLQVVPMLPPLLNAMSRVSLFLSSLGTILKGSVILFFV